MGDPLWGSYFLIHFGYLMSHLRVVLSLPDELLESHCFGDATAVNYSPISSFQNSTYFKAFIILHEQHISIEQLLLNAFLDYIPARLVLCLLEVVLMLVLQLPYLQIEYSIVR